MQTRGVKGGLLGAELIKDDTHGPHITLEVVGLALDDLRREVVWRSDNSPSVLHGRGKYLSDTEVTNLYDSRASEEDVLTLEVTMEDLPIMDVFKTETDLGKPLEHLLLTKWLAPLLFNFVLQITAYIQFISKLN